MLYNLQMAFTYPVVVSVDCPKFPAGNITSSLHVRKLRPQKPHSFKWSARPACRADVIQSNVFLLPRSGSPGTNQEPRPLHPCLTISPLEIPSHSLCLSESLSSGSPCSKPNTPGKSCPVHTACRGLWNFKKTHCLSCRSLASSGVMFMVHFHVSLFVSPPDCEPLEGETVPS